MTGVGAVLAARDQDRTVASEGAPAVAWQGIATVTVALLIGLPLGVALGRWSWSLLATELGIVSEPRVPVPTLIVTAVVTLGLSVVIALVPARRAARTPTALALRAE